MTTRTDSFDRADNTTSLGSPSDGGAAWVVSAGTWGIISNTGYTSSAGSQSVAYLEASAADVEVEVTMTGSVADAGVVARLSDDNNYNLITIQPSKIELYERVAGSFFSLALNNTTFTYASGNVIKFTVDSGSALTGFQDGVQKLTATDSTHAANTKHGIRSQNDTAIRFNDLTITDPAAGGGATDAGLLVPTNLRAFLGRVSGGFQ